MRCHILNQEIIIRTALFSVKLIPKSTSKLKTKKTINLFHLIMQKYLTKTEATVTKIQMVKKDFIYKQNTIIIHCNIPEHKYS